MSASLSASLRASPLRVAHRRRAMSSLTTRAAPAAPVAALTQDELKKQAAHQAVDYVKSGMKLGLGTGSTAAFAVARIGELMKR
jgi:ribose 5-phosphate isomerase A